MKKFLAASILAVSSLVSTPQPEQPLNVSQLFSLLNIHCEPHADWIQQLNSWGALSQPQQELRTESNPLPLFSAYPQLKTIPHISLCNLPTPVHPLQKLQTVLGIENLFLKNDGISGKTYGGNKPRKLEFELARAQAHGATAVITFGCAGSNHAVATSEYTHLLGMVPLCMLKPQPNSTVVRKNLLLHLSNGTQLHYYPSNDARKIGTICTWLDYKNTYGNYPYIIPTGGSTALGTIGFVNAACELKKQIQEGLLPEPDYIYVACGSCATTAGLLLGCKAAGLSSKIVAVAVEPEDTQGEFKTNITKLFTETNALLHSVDDSFPLFSLPENNLIIELNFCGPHYAVFTPQGMEARQLLQDNENIIIDGTYTAKAFAALLAHARANQLQDKNVLFWNTYCGNEFEERIAHLDYKNLPVCFHSYFEDNVQELDKEITL